MKILFLISLLICSIYLGFQSVEAYTIKQVQNSNYDYNNTNIYDNDLSRIEKYLFRQTFRQENNSSRLNRIEREIFNQNYPSMTISQRMNKRK